MNTEKFHEVKDVRFIENFMILKIDGKDYKFNLGKISKVLLRANKTEREFLKIDESGYGIHWPLLDEDLSIDGLLGIIHEIPISGKGKKRGINNSKKKVTAR